MPAIRSYFRFRHPFDFRPHRYDIGRPFAYNKALADNFFVLKIYEIEPEEYSDLYHHQLGAFLERYPGEEEDFFNKVTDVVSSRIKYYKGLDPFSSRYASSQMSVQQLQGFLAFLNTIDQWHRSKPIEAVLEEKNQLIGQQQATIARLEAQLAVARQYDASEKINITKGGLPVLIDLMRKIQRLSVAPETKLVSTQTQSPWYKMIAKYFQHCHQDIPLETIRNYFPAKATGRNLKAIEIAEGNILFDIIPKGAK